MVGDSVSLNNYEMETEHFPLAVWIKQTFYPARWVPLDTKPWEIISMDTYSVALYFPTNRVWTVNHKNKIELECPAWITLA
jgi:hypothetical protein